VIFWPVASLVLLADLMTKALAEAALGPPGFAHRVVGDVVRLNLVYNPGAAFGLHVGPWSRWIFLALTAVVLRVLWGLYRSTRDRDNVRTFALALVIAGASATPSTGCGRPRAWWTSSTSASARGAGRPSTWRTSA
jgi:signal peptidase II